MQLLEVTVPTVHRIIEFIMRILESFFRTNYDQTHHDHTGCVLPGALVGSLNGLAGVMLLEGQAEEAVKTYREAVRVIEENKQVINVMNGLPESAM
jgi:hypothetical protein